MSLTKRTITTLGMAAAATVGSVALASPAAARTPGPPVPSGWPSVSTASETAHVRLAPGVSTWHESYQTADGPEATSIVSVDLGNRSVRMDTVESHDRVADPADEATASMADRTGALAGINGDYFAIHAAGSPLGGTIRSGRIWKSPRPDYQAQLRIGADGRARIGEVDLRGTVSDGDASTAITSVNTLADAAAGGIDEVTPDLGASPVAASTLVIGTWRDGTLRVQEVRASVTSVPALARDQRALIGAGAGGAWLATHVQARERLRVDVRTTAPKTTALLDGATVLVRGGTVYTDPTGTPPSGRNPETMVGVSRDGRQLLLVVIDGRQPTRSIGVSPLEAAQYLVAHGADSGILLDGGGSSTMVTRAPGAASVAIANSVSDAAGERPVANGLFVYRR